MRSVVVLVLALVVVACGSSPKRSPDPGPSLAEGSEASTMPASAPSPGQGESVDARCLPLIGCGCFMQCSMGFFEEPEYGEWKVNYYDTMVMAKIEPHCVGGDCTDVFAVHTCQKMCEPEALKVSCAIEPGMVVGCVERPR